MIVFIESGLEVCSRIHYRKRLWTILDRTIDLYIGTIRTPYWFRLIKSSDRSTSKSFPKISSLSDTVQYMVNRLGFVEPCQAEEKHGYIFFLVFEKSLTSRHWKSSRFNFESFSTLNFWIILLENVYRHKLRSFEPKEDRDLFLRSSPYKPDTGSFSRKSKNSKN